MPDVVTQRTEYPDSIEIGTSGKGGVIKVYFNADDLVGAKRRIENAVNARQHLLTKLSGG
ncbi:MAG: hypothetical protein ABFC24_08625 [Methanoregulaceae archaeon]